MTKNKDTMLDNVYKYLKLGVSVSGIFVVNYLVNKWYLKIKREVEDNIPCRCEDCKPPPPRHINIYM